MVSNFGKIWRARGTLFPYLFSFGVIICSLVFWTSLPAWAGIFVCILCLGARDWTLKEIGEVKIAPLEQKLRSQMEMITEVFGESGLAAIEQARLGRREGMTPGALAVALSRLAPEVLNEAFVKADRRVRVQSHNESLRMDLRERPIATLLGSPVQAAVHPASETVAKAVSC